MIVQSGRRTHKCDNYSQPHDISLYDLTGQCGPQDYGSVGYILGAGVWRYHILWGPGDEAPRTPEKILKRLHKNQNKIAIFP